MAIALASATGADRERHLRQAEKMAAQIESEEMAYANPYANLIRAGIARRRGDDQRAISLLEKSAIDFDAAHMRLYAAVSRRCLGEVLGDDRGRELKAQSEEWMSKQEIKNPIRMMNLLAPGF